jgi:uncharacterized protein (TIGR00299 family) protein
MIAYLEPFAGISGDMLLGALLDAGWRLDDLQSVVGALGLDGVQVEAESVVKQGIAGTQVQVIAPDAQPQRHPADLKRIIEGAALPAEVKTCALTVIDRLAQVEAEVHGMLLEEVHFHEIGAVDTLVDVVGTISGFHALAIKRIECAPLPWSGGMIKTQHGLMPVPPPAVAALLKDIPVIGVDIQGEMVTPTGAVLAVTLADRFGEMPRLTVRSVGYGAGQRNWPDRPNLLRLVVGEAADDAGTAQVESLTMLACNLDDMQPEWYAPVMARLFDAGALDVWLTPIYMKKGRPAVMIEVLCEPGAASTLKQVLFEHTTTLGIREMAVTRRALPRRSRVVDTEYGPIRVKEALQPSGVWRPVPEHDDCLRLASEHGVSIRQVWLTALREAEA